MKDYIKQIDGAERRYFTNTLEFRQDGEVEYFEGYAAKFDSPTDLGWATEVIRQGAFDAVLSDDVRGLFNHEPNILLGRTVSKTMEVYTDAVGLRYKITYNPKDPDHVRVMEKVKRGDVSQSSFAFSIDQEIWDDQDGKNHRQIIKVKRLYDVSPVTYPAYTDTTVAARSFEAVSKEVKPIIQSIDYKDLI